jgi:hypothetical protein
MGALVGALVIEGLPTVVAEVSERGWGSCPITVPAPPPTGTPSTVGTVEVDPPPRTMSVPPITAPAPSWTADGRVPSVLSVPVARERRNAPSAEVSADVSPPRRASAPEPSGSTTIRLRGLASCHDGSVTVTVVARPAVPEAPKPPPWLAAGVAVRRPLPAWDAVPLVQAAAPSDTAATAATAHLAGLRRGRPEIARRGHVEIA